MPLQTMTAIERHFRVKFLLEKMKAIQDEILGIESALPEQCPQAAFDCLEESAVLIAKAGAKLKSLPTQVNLEAVLNVSVEAVAAQKALTREKDRCQQIGGGNVTAFHRPQIPERSI